MNYIFIPCYDDVISQLLSVSCKILKELKFTAMNMRIVQFKPDINKDNMAKMKVLSVDIQQLNLNTEIQ